MPPIPDHIRDAILEAIKAGQKSRNAIARDYGVSVGSVTNIAKRAGLTTAFDRSATKRATAASVADTASRRATLAERLIRLAELSMDQAVTELGEASARDAAVVLGIAVDKHLAVERHDSAGKADTSAVRAWLNAQLNDGSN